MNVDLHEYNNLIEIIARNLIVARKKYNKGPYYATTLKRDVHVRYVRHIKILEVTDNMLAKIIKLQAEYVMKMEKEDLIESINRTFGSICSNGTYTLEEIGKVLGVTRERVRQLELSAIKKLKHPSIGRVLREQDLPENTTNKTPWEE